MSPKTSPHSTDLFHLVVENVEDFAVFMTDTEGRVVSWNPGVGRVLGYTEEEFIGQHASVIFTPEDRELGVPEWEMRTAAAEGRAQDKRWHVRRDGSRFWADGLLMLLRDEAGGVHGFAKIMRDDTERKEAEERQARAARHSNLRADVSAALAEGGASARDILRRCAEAMVRHLDAAFARIWTLNAEDNVLELQASAGMYTHLDGPHARVPVGRLKIGLIAEERRPHLTNDVQNDPRVGDREWARREGMVAFAGYPLTVEGRLAGVMALFAREPLHEDTLDALAAVADTIAQGIERKRFEEELARLLTRERAAREAAEKASATLERLHSVADIALKTRELEELLHGLLGRLREDFAADTVVVLLLAEDGRRLVVRAAVGLEEEVAAGVSVPVGRGIAGRIAASREPLVIEDLSRVEVVSAYLRDRGVKSLAGVPLLVEGRVIGVIHVGTLHHRRFDEDDVRLLQTVADRAAIAIDRARLLESERKARAEAEEANRLKDEFLATLSHELRTPLTSILGWARMLRAGKVSEEATERALETIERNARAQSQLIEDILDVSRIVSGKMRLDTRPVDLASVIQGALDTARPAAEARGVRLQPVLDYEAGTVLGDPDRLQQVVWNLLSNAIKFTPKGGRVQVLLGRADSYVEVVVSDTGRGISPELLPHVFERFRQADAAPDRQHAGLGLGLAIVRHLVELHGGTVRAESAGEGHGATFTVRLPLTIVRTPAARGRDAGTQSRPASGDPDGFNCPPELAGLHVLVVEDEEDSRALISEVLVKCGARVTAVGTAAEALEEVSSTRPDVLVSDIGLPGEDGYSLIRKVRLLPEERGGRTPAAALTAYARAEDRVRALRSGFQIHVTKPVEPAELVTVVANLAGRTGGV